MIKASFRLFVKGYNLTPITPRAYWVQQILKMVIFCLGAMYGVIGHAAEDQLANQDEVVAQYLAVNGGVLAIPLESFVDDTSAGLTATFQGRRGFTHNHVTYFSVAMDTVPGTYSVQLNNGSLTQTVPVKIENKAYTEQHITIENQNMVTPPKETLERISQEAVKQRKLYASFTSQIEIGDGFKLPLKGPLTSLFGHKRFFNGQPRNPHSGLDIAAPTGTPIAAPANGTVVLVDDLYFNGKTVFIDHGQGLITMYCHMDKTTVEEGALIKQGETLGLVGATGRVTGPHLHWSVSLGGIRIDPQIFMSALNKTQDNSSGVTD